MLRCKPELLDPQLKVVVHVPQYDSIKDAILADKTKNGGSTAIVALGASGGVGTTWMARRLDYDKEVVDFFPEGIICITLGEDTGCERPACKI